MIQPKHPSTPNILLITTDQQRAELFGSNTAWDVHAPNLDRLRRRSTLLTQTTSVCPVCMPARFSWFTGLYPSQGAARLMENCHDWPSDVPTMPQALKRQGYHSELVGKIHNLAGLYPRDVVAQKADSLALGFDEVFEVSGKGLVHWFDCEYSRFLDRQNLLDRYRAKDPDAGDRPVDWLTDEITIDRLVGLHAVDRIEQLPTDQPWYMHVSFCNPHPPYDPPKSYRDRHAAGCTPPPTGEHDADSEQKWREMREAYISLVELVDDEIGRVVKALEQSGQADSTVILFSTDHGDMLGDRQLKGKALPYEASVRTPIMVSYPRMIAQDQQLYAPVESIDLTATICEIAGVDPATALPGSPALSFWQYITGNKPSHRTHTYAEFGSPEQGWRMLRTLDWKYIHNANSQDELYHLTADPDESCNLVSDSDAQHKLAELRALLVSSMMRCMRPNSDKGHVVYETIKEMRVRNFAPEYIQNLPCP